MHNVSQVTKKVAGWYTCAAVSPAGSISSKFFLAIQSPEETLNTTSHKDHQLNTNENEKEHENEQSNLFTNSLMDSSFSKQSNLLQDHLADSQFDISSNQETSRFEISSHPETIYPPPLMVMNPSATTVLVSEQVLFKCQVEGEYYPPILWFRGNTSIHASKKYHIKTDGVLIIQGTIII